AWAAGGGQGRGRAGCYAVLLPPRGAPEPLATRKELHYFDRFHSEPFGEADAAAYGGYFPRPQGLCAGEWSPSYLPAPRVPAMLAAAAPGARGVGLLRDPIEPCPSALRRPPPPAP